MKSIQLIQIAGSHFEAGRQLGPPSAPRPARRSHFQEATDEMSQPQSESPEELRWQRN
jgi:hypothetical protein